MTKKLIVEAPAKVNLTLDVKRKRPDGYHELETVMHQVNLVDRLSFEEGPNLNVKSDSPLVPQDKNNLAHMAARTLLEKFGTKAGVNIFIEKNIPVGAGLAGGSTDAAATLLGVNQLFSLGAGLQDLLDIGITLGSDVPFCLQGATALATGRGEVLQTMPIGPELIIVLVKPPYQASTAEVYAELDLDRIASRPDNQAFLQAWNRGDLRGLALNMINVLESVTIGKYPEIEGIKQRLIQMGAINAVMSGSGPTVLGLFQEPDRARQAVIKMKEQYQQVFIVSSYVRSDQ